MLSRRLASVAMPYLSKKALADDVWPAREDPLNLRIPSWFRSRRVRMHRQPILPMNYLIAFSS